ncbi:WecB/TagA/CpsF family glycosyltransferase [uncultured Croceicoccus sp.]|uniref:WecB/TagA/CpsF family glycosyltransferase n=1 Tax=uncultured Croceicoccus sp. TaxID=1295329 RepID=UPI00262E3C8F|nr:WecB/TagA/CpsF family glycosyltransferase [uncultured Croceicoccus sp.]
MKHIPASAFRTATVPFPAPAARFTPASPFETRDMFGLPIANASREDTADHIVALARSATRHTINFINAHCVNTMKKDRTYRAALHGSDILLPDGAGMEIASKAFKQPRIENLNGTDLFPMLCERAAKAGVGIFLLGGQEGVAEDAAAWACAEWPALRISGTQNGYLDRDDEDALIERINRSGARMLFVGFGVPLQETWIARNRDRLDVPVVLGVGGLFDYYSGRITRAPAMIRACRGEWAWRLAMEPRRMAGRYLVGNGVFLAHTALEAAKLRGLDRAASEMAKRASDIVVAVCALLMLLPIFLVAALAVWMEDRGPVFFRQTRIGRAGKPFTMLKFRSMYTDAEARRAELLARSDRQGTCFKMTNDPRITAAGRVLRRYSIDELPQLINVLTGSMSIVGPRPALANEVAAYRGHQIERLHGAPGITCTWQVKGRALIPFERQAIMDRAYLRKRSFMTDMRLLAATVPAVIGGRGAC